MYGESNDERKAELVHFGVLGMKWGRRKQEDSGGSSGGSSGGKSGIVSKKESKEALNRLKKKFKDKEKRDDITVEAIRSRARKDVDEIVSYDISSSLKKGKTMSSSEKRKLRDDYEKAFSRELNYTRDNLRADRRKRAIVTVAAIIGVIGYYSIASVATFQS